LSIVDYPGFEDCDPPDMETYSKALNAGQYPLSVLALTPEAADLYVRGVYGNTMTTNPRALEVGCEVLDSLTPDLRRNIRERGAEFLKKLEALKKEFPEAIERVTGTGLMLCAELNPKQYRVAGKRGFIGACEPLEALLKNEIVPQILRDTILEMASPAIRHTGTLGGNVGNASPAGDSLVPLYILNAVIETRSKNNTRRTNIRDFIQGVRKIDLHPDEIISRIIINKIDFTKASFVKVGPRLSDAISKVSFAGAITILEGAIYDLRFAFGAVNTTVVRRPEIECAYIKKTIQELKDSIDEIIEEYKPYIKPIDDQRSNKEYRKEVSINLLRGFIEEL